MKKNLKTRQLMTTQFFRPTVPCQSFFANCRTHYNSICKNQFNSTTSHL